MLFSPREYLQYPNVYFSTLVEGNCAPEKVVCKGLVVFMTVNAVSSDVGNIR